MNVVDAGVQIGFFDGADAHHDAAVEIIEQNQPPYLVHAFTLAEVLVGPARQGCEGEMWRELREIGAEAADLGPEEPPALARLRAQWNTRPLTTSAHSSQEARHCAKPSASATSERGGRPGDDKTPGFPGVFICSGSGA